MDLLQSWSECLAKVKLLMTPYDPLDVHAEFDFVCVDFVPHTAPDKGEDGGAKKGPKTEKAS